MSEAITLTDSEREVVVLTAALDSINSMVNYEVLELSKNDPNSEIRFKSSTHQKFFNIMLVDFLSRPDMRMFGMTESYLSSLRSICDAAHFNVGGSVRSLRDAVTALDGWLKEDILVEKIWLPSIEKEASLLIKRIEFIKICGDISKHNFGRLTKRAKDIQEIFARNEISITFSQAIIALDEFYEWFHTNIFSYHSSAIAEFLNNVRWGIHQYLQPEFRASIVFDDERPPAYKYTYPKNVAHPFAKNCYWNLMNEVRSEPYMPRFEVTQVFEDAILRSGMRALPPFRYMNKT